MTAPTAHAGTLVVPKISPFCFLIGAVGSESLSGVYSLSSPLPAPEGKSTTAAVPSARIGRP